jgi:hypothetical protein
MHDSNSICCHFSPKIIPLLKCSEMPLNCNTMCHFNYELWFHTLFSTVTQYGKGPLASHQCGRGHVIEICGGQSGTGAGFFQVLQFALPIRIPLIASHSSSGTGTIGQTVGSISTQYGAHGTCFWVYGLFNYYSRDELFQAVWAAVVSQCLVFIWDCLITNQSNWLNPAGLHTVIIYFILFDINSPDMVPPLVIALQVHFWIPNVLYCFMFSVYWFSLNL